MPSRRAVEREFAVARFQREYDPNRSRDGVLCCKCLQPHDSVFDQRMLYRMDGVAMMHDMGDIGNIRFESEADCLNILRERLTAPSVGAVVVWNHNIIYFKERVPSSYVDAKVHACDGCSCFWVHTSNASTLGDSSSAPLQDLSTSYANSFESDIPCEATGYPDGPSKRCLMCNQHKEQLAFSKKQWKKNREGRRCKACVLKQQLQECNSDSVCCKECKFRKAREEFSKNQWRKNRNDRTCRLCVENQKFLAVAEDIAGDYGEQPTEQGYHRQMDNGGHDGNYFSGSGSTVWRGMSKMQYGSTYSHCAEIGYYGDPDLWDIMAGCSGD